MIKWKIEKRKISDLIPYHKNPRKLTKDQFEYIQKSLEKFGLIDKPIINTDNTIIGGHQRIQVLKKMKVKEVEVYVPSEPLEAKDLEELNIRLNQGGTFDFDILADQFELKDLVEYGFNENDFEIDIGEIEAKPIQPEKKKNSCPSCGYEF